MRDGRNAPDTLPDVWTLPMDPARTSAFLTRGWADRLEGPPGRPYVWMTDTTASVAVPRPPATTYRLVLDVIPFLVAGKVEHQDLWVHADGLFAGFGRLLAPGRVECSITSDRSSPGTLGVTLTAPDAAVPYDLGAGADHRLLGVAVEALRLEW